MKILHFADLHLGVENYNPGINPDTGLSLRLHDFLNVFDEVTEYALSHQVDLVLFCGDAYKSREPSQTHQREFAKRVWRLASSGIPVFLVTGNHDIPNAVGRATTIEIFKTLSTPNVIVANTPGTYRIETKSGPLQIIALPWARRNAMLTRESTKNLTFEQVNEQIESLLTDVLQQEIAGLDPKLPAVLAAHVTLSNAKYGSERSMTMGHDYTLLHSNIANPKLDYVALGHIHKKQVLDDRPPVVYAGSLQRIDFSEEDDEKGFFIVDIAANKRVKFDFHPVKARRFMTIKIDIGEQESDPTGAVIKAISCHDVSDAVVRVQISLPERTVTSLDDAAMRKAMKAANLVASISHESPHEHRPRLEGFSAESLQPLDALKAYCEVKKPSIDAKLFVEYGERIIHEVQDESAVTDN